MKPVPHKGHTNIRLYNCDMKPVPYKGPANIRIYNCEMKRVPHKDTHILGSITVT